MLIASNQQAIANIQAIEDDLRGLEQVDLPVRHSLHAGVYARTLHVPAGVRVAGALIKVPTLLIVSGHGQLFDGYGVIDVEGYQVLEGAANRRAAFQAISDCDLTMCFATQATNIEDAEREFTDDYLNLQNRRGQLCAEL